MIFLSSRNRDSCRGKALSGQIYEGVPFRDRFGNSIVGYSKRQRSRQKTYQYDTADEHQVPGHVFSTLESRVSSLYLAEILVEEICVEYQAQLWASDEKRRHKPPYLRR